MEIPFGRTIKGIKIEDDTLIIDLVWQVFTIWDGGQDCCEHRYMNCDDDLDYYIDSTLQGVELRDGPNASGTQEDYKECQFLHIMTNKGTFVVANYNEHNGYYGGFSLVSKLERKAK